MIERLGVDEGADVELYRAPVETRAVLDANRIDIAAMVARDRSRGGKPRRGQRLFPRRSEEHTSELQSLMRISYAVFCLKKKKLQIIQNSNTSDMIKRRTE